MNIISEKKEFSRMIDGISTILTLPEEQFNLLIQQMNPNGKKIMEELWFYYQTDKCSEPENIIQIGLEKTYDENRKYISRRYYGGTYFSMYQILEQCQNMLNNYAEDSKEYSRICEIIHTRDLAAFKAYYSKDKNLNPIMLDKIFEILSSDEIYSKFLDYSNNKKEFAIDGEEIPFNKYIEHLGEIFGIRDRKGDLSDTNQISIDFFIPKLKELKNRYSQMFDKINMERYVNPRYTFSVTFPMNKVIRDGDEPNWEIAPEIYEEIYQEMPENLSLEEKAMHIYSKMCIMFDYDEGYLYRKNLNKINYESKFSKEHLEGIRPGDKITCFDFSRMYAKLINELDGDITAVMILQGANEGHALAGFYTTNVSATVDAININSKEDATNDLTKAKKGIYLKGVKIIYDKEGIIEQAINKVYSNILGKNPKSIKEYIQELEHIPTSEDIPDDIGLKLQSLLEVMKKNKLSGNEFTQTFWEVLQTNFLGKNKLERAYLGELKESNNSKRFKRHILLRQVEQNKDKGSLKEVYLIDTDTLDLTTCWEEDIIARLKSWEFIYENEDRKLFGIDRGEYNDTIK